MKEGNRHKAQMIKELAQYPWEAVLTIRTAAAKDEETAYKLIQSEIVRPLMHQLKTEIAGYGVLNLLRNKHAHVLLFSKTIALTRLTNQTFYNRLFKPCNKIVNHPKAVDFKLYESEGAISYMLDNLPERSGKGGMLYFNHRLLSAIAGKR